VRIAVSADELTGLAALLPKQLRARGHQPVLHGLRRRRIARLGLGL